MNMPFGNIQGLMQAYQQFMTNRPKDLGNDPNQVIQKMMNSGAVNQQQYNQAKSIANMIKRFMPNK